GSSPREAEDVLQSEDLDTAAKANLGAPYEAYTNRYRPNFNLEDVNEASRSIAPAGAQFYHRAGRLASTAVRKDTDRSDLREATNPHCRGWPIRGQDIQQRLCPPGGGFAPPSVGPREEPRLSHSSVDTV